MLKKIYLLSALCLPLLLVSCTDPPADPPPEGGPIPLETIENRISTIEPIETLPSQYTARRISEKYYRIVLKTSDQSFPEWAEAGYVIPIVQVAFGSGWDDDVNLFSLERKINNNLKMELTAGLSDVGEGVQNRLNSIEVYTSIVCHSKRYLCVSQVHAFQGRRFYHVVKYITIDIPTGDIVQIDDLIDINDDFLEKIQNEERFISPGGWKLEKGEIKQRLQYFYLESERLIFYDPHFILFEEWFDLSDIAEFLKVEPW